MTTRIHLALFAVCLTASACVVAGEDDPSLDEIEASSCSKPGSREPGELEAVTLYKEGKEVSIESLSRGERELLDDTLDFIEDGGHSGDTGCDFYPSGWTCEGGGWLCTCIHGSSGPTCGCDTTTC